uniref:Uncharacterized protein n=1 Tax=Meloidogyne hapla TaxID=6305 RepID=A0A1I8B328_MELHA
MEKYILHTFESLLDISFACFSVFQRNRNWRRYKRISGIGSDIQKPIFLLKFNKNIIRNGYLERAQNFAVRLHNQQLPAQIFLNAVANAINSNVPFDPTIQLGGIQFDHQK